MKRPPENIRDILNRLIRGLSLATERMKEKGLYNENITFDDLADFAPDLINIEESKVLIDKSNKKLIDDSQEEIEEEIEEEEEEDSKIVQKTISFKKIPKIKITYCLDPTKNILIDGKPICEYYTEENSSEDSN